MCPGRHQRVVVDGFAGVTLPFIKTCFVRISLSGAAAAVELCGEAHAMLGRREEDERTWDHASGELAMSHLCLGVERRCVFRYLVAERVVITCFFDEGVDSTRLSTEGEGEALERRGARCSTKAGQPKS